MVQRRECSEYNGEESQVRGCLGIKGSAFFEKGGDGAR